MDSDGQHPAWLIPEFMATSRNPLKPWCSDDPCSMPRHRCCACAAARCPNFSGPTWRPALPASATRCTAFASTRSPTSSRRWSGTAGCAGFDFDPEAAVRLVWRGLRPINLNAPVKYLTPEEGGVLAFPVRARQPAADRHAHPPGARCPGPRAFAGLAPPARPARRSSAAEADGPGNFTGRLLVSSPCLRPTRAPSVIPPIEAPCPADSRPLIPRLARLVCAAGVSAALLAGLRPPLAHGPTAGARHRLADRLLLQAVGATAPAPTADVLAGWWRQFNDRTLDALIAEALSRHTDVRAALASLDEARAVRMAVEAGAGPQAGLNAGASRGRSGGRWSTGSSLGFSASWEPDLFGERSASLSAARGQRAGDAGRLVDDPHDAERRSARGLCELARHTGATRTHCREPGRLESTLSLSTGATAPD